MKIKSLFMMGLIVCGINAQVIGWTSIANKIVCPLALTSPLDAIFSFVESIANKSDLPTTRGAYENIYYILQHWKTKTKNDIKAETLSQIAYFLGTHPSILLKLEKVHAPSL